MPFIGIRVGSIENRCVTDVANQMRMGGFFQSTGCLLFFLFFFIFYKLDLYKLVFGQCLIQGFGDSLVCAFLTDPHNRL